MLLLRFCAHLSLSLEVKRVRAKMEYLLLGWIFSSQKFPAPIILQLQRNDCFVAPCSTNAHRASGNFAFETGKDPQNTWTTVRLKEQPPSFSQPPPRPPLRAPIRRVASIGKRNDFCTHATKKTNTHTLTRLDMHELLTVQGMVLFACFRPQENVGFAQNGRLKLMGESFSISQ